jgi:hypothetical protein
MWDFDLPVRRRLAREPPSRFLSAAVVAARITSPFARIDRPARWPWERQKAGLVVATKPAFVDMRPRR